MNYQIKSSQKSFHSVITNEQLHQIITAITDGRYSWACVLILRCVGHNPLHFIPQRTYSRLVKENCQVSAVNTSSKIDKSQSSNSLTNNSNPEIECSLSK